MRLAVPIAIVALAAAVLAGCGGSSDGESSRTAPAAPQANGSSAPAGATARVCTTKVGGVHDVRVTGVSCQQGEQTIAAWHHTESCVPAPGSSRSGCRAGPYRCLSAMTERGRNVSCSRPGRSVVFTVED